MINDAAAPDDDEYANEPASPAKQGAGTLIDEEGNDQRKRLSPPERVDQAPDKST